MQVSKSIINGTLLYYINNELSIRVSGLSVQVYGDDVRMTGKKKRVLNLLLYPFSIQIKSTPTTDYLFYMTRDPGTWATSPLTRAVIINRITRKAEVRY